jgi:hypothetical protein
LKKTTALLVALALLLSPSLALAAAEQTYNPNYGPRGGIPSARDLVTLFGTPTVTKVAGGNGQVYIDGPGPEAGFAFPRCMTVGSDGLLYIMDGANMRVFDGQEVRTEGSLWDQMEILKPWGLDDERVVYSMLTDQMVPTEDGILLCGRMYLPEKYDISFKVARTYWDNPEQPAAILYGFIYSFVMKYSEGRFSVIQMAYSGYAFWNDYLVELAPPDEEYDNYMATIVTENMDGTESIAWSRFCPSTSIDVGPDGSIYVYITRGPSLPDKETRAKQVATSRETKRNYGYSNAPDWLMGDSIKYVDRIYPDGRIEHLISWTFEIAGYERAFYREEEMNQWIWLLPDGRIAIYDGAYYGYALSNQGEKPTWERILSTQTEERLTWFDGATEMAGPMRRVLRFPTRIGKDIYAVDSLGVCRLMDATRIETVTVGHPGMAFPACFAAYADDSGIHYYAIDLQDLSLYKTDVPFPPAKAGLFLIPFSGKAINTDLPVIDGAIPVKPVADVLGIHLYGTTLRSLTGRTASFTPTTFGPGGEPYLDPETLEGIVNKISVIKYDITLDLVANRVLLDVDPTK